MAKISSAVKKDLTQSDLEKTVEMLKKSLRRIPHWKRVLIAKLIEGELSK